MAVVAGDFDAFTSEELFDEFTNPEKLVIWWPETAEVDLRVGGRFALCWPTNNWNLRGEYLAVSAGEHLAFTWSWDHEPSRPPQRVDVWFDCVHEQGTRIGIYHGPFQDTEEAREARQGVIEGWIHFCMRLGGVAPGKVD